MEEKTILLSSDNTHGPEARVTNAPIAVVDRVSKIYGQADNQLIALSDVSLTIQPGQSIALIGRSGSGKSTLLNLLGAVDRPTSGSITIDGTDLSKMSDGQLALFRRRRLGFVFQSFHLVPSLTVFDNVAVPWTLDRALNSKRKDEIQELLTRLGVAEKAKKYSDELSGGQQQRVAIARAIVHRPALLLADEPTGNLDAHTGRVILDLLDDMRREFGITLIMATHSSEAAERCDRSITLSDGCIVTG
jgi:putative ABC transport system ATP-binding protein